MSSKSPPPTKKDDQTTSSPTKKDDKASSLILTRTQSTYLNTRQLRNKASSRKKISEFTQQLLSPKRERSTKSSQSNKKKSPKDKKDKPNAKKRATVSVTKLVLESKREMKLAGKKHKSTAEPKVEPPAKHARVLSTGARPLTAQELIELCEEQSLDDDDFLEILTCESPVWWEEPPADKFEDEMFTAADEIQYFKEIYNQGIKVEPVTHTADIDIPTVKQQDDRFMKKRSKLENLLGNIKSKLTDTPPAIKNNIPSDIEKKMQSLESSDAPTSATDQTIKQEPEYHRKKSPSESTSSSSEDLFFGFQNEDVLKDFENMDIPIENMKEKEIKPDKNQGNKETRADNIPKDQIDTKDAINKDTTTESSSLETGKKSTDLRKKESLSEDAVCSTQNSLPSNSNNNTKACISDTTNCQNNSKSIETNKFDSVKIYYIDTTSTNSKKNIPDTKASTNKSDLSKETASSVLTKEEPRTKTNSSSEHPTADNKNKLLPETSKKTDACSSNNESIATKDKQEATSNKSKHLYKDQLMAVYKIITDENYRETFKKTVTNGVEKVNASSDALDTLLKDDSKSRSLLLANYKKKNFIVDLINTDKSELKNEKDADDGKEINIIKIDTDDENKTKNGERDEETCIPSVSRTDPETNQTQNNEEPTEIKSTNASHTDCKDSIKDTISGNRDNANTEGSLNITSNVKSAKYCLKCSSIFETETCSYCAKKSQVNQDTSKNGSQCQQPRKGNI